MINTPYLLVLNIALHRHAGSYWADTLWKKDLEAHRAGISRLSIACPVLAEPPPPGWARLDGAIVVHPLPSMGRFAALAAPLYAARLWRSISAARIVHTGVAGWPFPLGWIAIPIARLRRRRLVLVVESAFWRIPPGARPSWLARARARWWERLNVRAVAACDVRFFTTDAYRQELRGSDAGGTAYVLPAVWIDDSQLIERDQLEAVAAHRHGRLLFAGRLAAAKGVDMLIEAVEASGVAVDFVGEGDLCGLVTSAARRRPDLIRLLDPVSYGPAFSTLLDDYAALVVPTVTDEQPRVIFDAFARGLAVLASATPGNRQIVEHGRTGMLFAADDCQALATALRAARDDPNRLTTMGMAARDAMTGRTHAAMHADRARLIKAALSPKVKSR